ncbi:MAG: zinc ribbon domain-containing protein [Planctomycetes bacterium]|nr:zinc ribbon domain-containing protein [Planctomycetota bacterium]
MAISQTTRHCAACGERTLHQKTVFGAGWGLALTLITGGLFLPIWLLLVIVDAAKPYVCVLCRELPRPPSMCVRGAAEERGHRHAFPRCARRSAGHHHAQAGPFPGAEHQRCPACGAALPLRARYCRDCGAPLAE